MRFPAWLLGLLLAAGRDTLAALVRERQDLAGKWQALDAAGVNAVTKPQSSSQTESLDPAGVNAVTKPQSSSQTERFLRDAFDMAGKQLDALDVRIAREFPQFADLSNPRPMELKDAQALLAPDEAMLNAKPRSRSFRPSFAPRGSPECWRAEASWSGVFMGSPARRCGTPGRAPLWPRQEGARAFSSRFPEKTPRTV
jgi:hypothetical protein